MTELVLVSSVVLLSAGLLLAWMASPWRSLLAWVCTLSVQLPYKLFFSDFRPALSDLFLPSMALALVLSNAKASCVAGKRSALSGLVLAFATVFFLIGNTTTYFELRTIPQWTWLNKDIGLVDLVLCYFAFLQLVDSQEKLQAIVKVFVLSGSAINLVALLGGIARYAFGISNMMMRDGSSLRLAGFNINPNSYGGFVLCVMLLQFGLLLGGSKLLGISPRTQYFNLALLGMACLMTLSRSALLGMIVGIVALLCFFPAKASMRVVGLALLVLAATYAVVHWYGTSPATSAEFWNVELSGRTISERLDTNRAAMNMYLDRPATVMLGIGVGAFLAHAQHVLGIPLIIHNDFLWLLVEVGPLGLLLAGAIFLVSLRNCVAVARARSADSPLAAGVACCLIGTLAWTTGTEGLWHRHFWFLLALSESCYRLWVTDRRTLLLEKRRHLWETRPRLAFAPGDLLDS